MLEMDALRKDNDEAGPSFNVENRKENRLRLEKLQKEAKSNAELFNNIMDKWTKAKPEVIHKKLRDNLKKQQKLCSQFTGAKDRLLDELQQELEARDVHFEEDQEKEAAEIDLLFTRAKEQTSSLKDEFSKELSVIESSFTEECKDSSLSASKNKLKQQRKERNGKEQAHLQQRMKMLEEHETLLDQLRAESAKDHRIKIERFVAQRLNQDLLKSKTSNELSQEKLEHDVEKLGKALEEYAITKAEHLEDSTIHQARLNELRKKQTTEKKQLHEEIKALTKKHKLLTQQQEDINKRIKHFEAADAKIYRETWQMKEEKAKALVGRAVDLDQVINEQVLGLTWSAPSLPLMDCSSQCTEQQVAAEVLEEEDDAERDCLAAGVDRKTVRNLLELLCDEMGWFIDSTTHELLSSLKKEEQTVLKLDLILAALGIRNEKDLNKMIKFLLKSKEDRTGSDQTEESNVIHPNDLLRGLKEFTAQKCKDIEASKPKRKSHVLVKMNDAEVVAHWENIANIIPDSKVAMWEALEIGLEMFHAELTERSRLLTETQQLKQQTTKLRMLLDKYQSSKDTC